MQTNQSGYYCQVNKIGFIAINGVGEPEFAHASTYSKMQRITVKNLADEVIFQSDTPTKPWNYQSVKAAISGVDTSNGADLYFGDEWQGSTEL